jgi:hypothetical protein
MGAIFIHEPPAKARGEELREAWQGIRKAVGDRTMWVVAGFLFFWTFSPSIGIPLYYFQTDTLKFSQQFIGLLGSLSAGASILGAFLYAPLSRRVSLLPRSSWSRSARGRRHARLPAVRRPRRARSSSTRASAASA